MADVRPQKWLPQARWRERLEVRRFTRRATEAHLRVAAAMRALAVAATRAADAQERYNEAHRKFERLVDLAAGE